MSEKELKNKPLVEAILEFKWELPAQTTSKIEADPHYRLLLGRFSEKVESDYPFHEPLPTTQIPDSMVAHMAQHRFRVSEGGWPLIQVGPGLMTVNETEGYTWDDFKQRCVKSVKSLLDAHPAKEDFKVQSLTLRYIDAVDVDFNQESVFNFLKDKMKTTISLPDDLFINERVKKNPTEFNWHMSFPTNDPIGIIALRFAIGSHMSQPALIWETLVQAGHIPAIPNGFPKWLEEAHNLIDDWFFRLIDGELKERFSGE